MRRVDDRDSTRILRCTIDFRMRQQQFHRAFLARIETNSRIDGAILLVNGRRMVARIAAHAAGGDVHRQPPLPRFRQILHIDRQPFRLGKIRPLQIFPHQPRVPFRAGRNQSNNIWPFMHRFRLVDCGKIIQRNAMTNTCHDEKQYNDKI